MRVLGSLLGVWIHLIFSNIKLFVFRCRTWVRNNFCNYTNYKIETKRQLCGESCGLCGAAVTVEPVNSRPAKDTLFELYSTTPSTILQESTTDDDSEHTFRDVESSTFEMIFESTTDDFRNAFSTPQISNDWESSTLLRVDVETTSVSSPLQINDASSTTTESFIEEFVSTSEAESVDATTTSQFLTTSQMPESRSFVVETSTPPRRAKKSKSRVKAKKEANMRAKQIAKAAQQMKNAEFKQKIKEKLKKHKKQ